MPISVVVPSHVDDSEEDAVIAEWYHSNGASVNQGDQLFRVQVGDAWLDVRAEHSGQLRQAIPQGRAVEPGSVVGLIMTEGEVKTSARAASESGGSARPLPKGARSRKPTAFDMAAVPDFNGDDIFTAAGPKEVLGRRILGKLRQQNEDEDEEMAGDSPVATAVIESLVEREEEDEAAEVEAAADTEAGTRAGRVRKLAFGGGQRSRRAATAAETGEEPEHEESRGTEEDDGLHMDVAEAVLPAAEEPETEAAEEAITEATPVPEPAAAATWEPTPQAAASAGNVVSMRRTVRLAECGKILAQLTRDWEGDGIEPEVTDLVVRAIARATANVMSIPAPSARLAIETFGADGRDSRVVTGAGTGSFKEMVRARRGESGGDDGEGAACVVVLAGGLGIEEIVPRAAAGTRYAFAAGAPAESTAIGDTTLVFSLAIAHSGGDDYDAARLLNRVGELIESPYGLLTD